mmetsp:Transcript_38755/g.89448  ORF Transcript_38755/g.89448 Transcript_38755/m.89448 type:complete len:793 (-) Transcript_38755:103-2481(-)
MALASLAKVSLLFCSLWRAQSQQPGTLEQEGNPLITYSECTLAGGCASKQMKLVLDANWRWIHSTSGYTNCYTGNQWDNSLCPSNTECAANCALEGVSASKYESTYGITEVDGGVRLNFVTGSNTGSRLYLLDDDGENYKMFYLKNREFAIDVDVSELQCGMNGAMYFVEMEADGGKAFAGNNAGAKYGTGYCDAQCPHDIKFINGEANSEGWVPVPEDFSGNMGEGTYGACCAEMDIWEANSMATAYTPHPCDIEGTYRCDGVACGDNAAGERYDGVCDKDGCDINPFRMGDQNFYGRGDHFPVNTLEPMTLVTQFLTHDGTDDGILSEIRRFYVQNGVVVYSPPSTILHAVGAPESDSITDSFCTAKKQLFNDVNDFEEKGGMENMGISLDRGHVMVLSLWDDVAVNMLWLDSSYPLDESPSTPGVKRGNCTGGVESTPQYVRSNYPSSGVIFRNVAVGEIGSTMLPSSSASTTSGVAATTQAAGGCGPAPGQNQPECNGQTEERCLQMIQYENKCAWTAPATTTTTTMPPTTTTSTTTATSTTTTTTTMTTTTTTTPTTTTTTTTPTTTPTTTTTTTITTTTTPTTTTTTTISTTTTTTTVATGTTPIMSETTTVTTAMTTTTIAPATTTITVTPITSTAATATTTTMATIPTTEAPTAPPSTTAGQTTELPSTTLPAVCSDFCHSFNNSVLRVGCDAWNGQEELCMSSFITHAFGVVTVPCEWWPCDSTCRAAGKALMTCPEDALSCSCTSTGEWTDAMCRTYCHGNMFSCEMDCDAQCSDSCRCNAL